jgi:ATP-binding cassette subfamily C (CFTR/MRP) protein 1
MPSVKTNIPSQALAIAVIVALSGLSLLEHGRLCRSSDGINVYLFFSIAFDAVQIRTLWLRLDTLKLTVAATVCVVLKVALLVVEAQGKKRFLFEKYQSLAPESLSGVFARRCFWWLNGTLIRGYQTLIQPNQLEAIKEDFASDELLDALERSYTKSKPVALPKIEFVVLMQNTGYQKSHRLIKSCLFALMSSFLAPVLPRLALMTFRYSQPFLFEAIVSFVQKPASERSQNNGYGLIAATGLLYLSLVISLTYYQHKTYQLVTRLRGSLVSLLYLKTLTSPPKGLSERASVTLMSVDVDGITSAAPNAHEVWASPVEIGVAVWLLQRQIGVICVVPLSIVICAPHSTIQFQFMLIALSLYRICSLVFTQNGHQTSELEPSYPGKNHCYFFGSELD